MSSFSSVVQKPGKKIVPKAAPRRNVPRKLAQANTEPLPSLQDGTPYEETGTSRSPAPVTSVSETASALGAVQSGIERDSIGPSMHSPSRVSIQVELPVLGVTSSTQLTTSPRRLGQAVEADCATKIASEPGVLRERSRSVDLESEQGQTKTRTEHRTSSELASDQSAEASSNGAQQQHIDADLYTTHTKRPRKAAIVSVASSLQRKKRKLTPPAASNDAHFRIPSVISASPSPHPSEQASRELLNNSSQPPDELLQSATRRAASVSELANSIESQTRLLRPQPEQSQSNDPSSGANNNPRSISASSKRGRSRLTIEEQAAEVIANATGHNSRSTKPRGLTPDNAENYELEPTKVTMGQLCEDSKLGKKSTLESEMQTNWTEILQRRKEDRERALANAEKRRRKGIGPRPLLDNDRDTVAALAPAMAVVNGIIVVEQASREIDRGAQLQQTAVQDLDNVREDRNYYKYVNQRTVGVKPGHGQRSKWDEESTERFFKALQIFGTDFLMISNMFPGFTRKQIKMKFIREEKVDKSRVLECLRNREPVCIEDYAQMANKESDDFHTLESIQKELDKQETQLREEDNQRRKREGFATTDNDNPDLHEEDDQNTAIGIRDGVGRNTASVEPGRFDTVAKEIAEAAATTKKRQRRPNAAHTRRGPKGGRRPEGGVEEVLGSINEVAV